MSELPGCMTGPSEPCDAFTKIQDERARLRASEKALLEALEPCGAWLKYAYGHVDSVTSDKVKAHLPIIDAAIAQATERG